MDEGEFRRVAGALRTFHKRFASLFGRKEAQRHGAQYVRGLLVTREERRNAENLAEAVVGSAERDARALQQFLTDSPWRHEAVLAELHRFLAEQLLPQDAGEGLAADGVYTLDGTGFAKRGRHSAGAGECARRRRKSAEGRTLGASTRGHWAKWTTARSESFWGTPQRAGTRSSTDNCGCPVSGRTTLTGAAVPEYRRQ